MKPKSRTLQDDILGAAVRIAQAEGPEAINIRRVAKEVGVAVGTVYNYFQSKDEILLSMAEGFWRDTVRDMFSQVKVHGFTHEVAQLYAILSSKMADFRAGLLDSIRQTGSNRTLMGGKAREASAQAVIRDTLADHLREDPHIQPDIWTPAFTPEGLADFVFSHMLLLLRQRATDMDFLIELLTRLLYTDQKEGNSDGTGFG